MANFLINSISAYVLRLSMKLNIEITFDWLSFVVFFAKSMDLDSNYIYNWNALPNFTNQYYAKSQYQITSKGKIIIPIKNA